MCFAALESGLESSLCTEYELGSLFIKNQQGDDKHSKTKGIVRAITDKHEKTS